MTANPPDSNNATAQRPVRPKLDIAGRPKTNRSTSLPREEILPERKYVAAERPDKTIREPAGEPSITLRAGATRDIGEANTLALPHGAKSARLNLIFRSERYSRYIVTITNVGGSEIFRNDDNRSIQDMNDGSRRLVVRLNDTSGMTEKDYIVKIEGQDPGEAPETIEEYYFHVRRGTKGSTAIPEEPAKKP